MKKIITIILVISTLTTHANSDSMPFTLDAVDLLTLQHTHGGTTASLAQAQANVFKKFWNWATTPFRPVWGEYDEPGYHSSGLLFFHNN